MAQPSDAQIDPTIQPMNQNLRRQGLVIGAIVIIATCLLVVLAGMWRFGLLGEREAQPETILSPDGRRVMIASINRSKADRDKYLCVKLTVKEVETGRVVWENQTSASDRMRWSAHWLDNNFIYLQSADIGDYCWEEVFAGVWQAVACPADAPPQ